MKNIVTHKYTGIIVLAAIVVLGAATFYLYRNNRKKYAAYIVEKKASTQPLAWLASLEEGYLKAWSAALQAGAAEFAYNGKRYNPIGGRAIRS